MWQVAKWWETIRILHKNESSRNPVGMRNSFWNVLIGRRWGRRVGVEPVPLDGNKIYCKGAAVCRFNHSKKCVRIKNANGAKYTDRQRNSIYFRWISFSTIRYYTIFSFFFSLCSFVLNFSVNVWHDCQAYAADNEDNEVTMPKVRSPCATVNEMNFS